MSASSLFTWYAFRIQIKNCSVITVFIRLNFQCIYAEIMDNNDCSFYEQNIRLRFSTKVINRPVYRIAYSFVKSKKAFLPVINLENGTCVRKTRGFPICFYCRSYRCSVFIRIIARNISL